MLEDNPLQYLEIEPQLLTESELLELFEVGAIELVLEALDLVTRDLTERNFGFYKILPRSSHEDSYVPTRPLWCEMRGNDIRGLDQEHTLNLGYVVSQLRRQEAAQACASELGAIIPVRVKLIEVSLCFLDFIVFADQTDFP